MSTLLTVSSVTFAYEDHVVLRDVSFTLKAGEVVALIGPNGSGKSTLIKTLFGQLRGGGKILWDDEELHGWNRRVLARQLAYLPQSPAHEPDQRVLEVLRLGRAPYWRAFGIESQADVTAVREIVALLDLEELIDRPMDALSGGQRQRVFLGRCLVQQPRALLLDEPGTFLDLRHQVDLGSIVRRLAREQGIGTLMASHDLNLSAQFADRMILLHNGTVAAAGPPAEVLKSDLLSKVYGVAMETAVLADGRTFVVPSVKRD